jgi:hypothetical protein
MMLRGYDTLRKRDKVAGDHSYKIPDGNTDRNHQESMMQGRAAQVKAAAKYEIGQFVRTSAGSGRIIEITVNGSIAIRNSRRKRIVISPNAIFD